MPALGVSTVTVNASVWLRPAEAPVKVAVWVPAAAVAVAVSVSVTLPGALGLKPAVTPLGNPDTESVTVPVKPFCGVTATTLDADMPG